MHYIHIITLDSHKNLTSTWYHLPLPPRRGTGIITKARVLSLHADQREGHANKEHLWLTVRRADPWRWHMDWCRQVTRSWHCKLKHTQGMLTSVLRQ